MKKVFLSSVLCLLTFIICFSQKKVLGYATAEGTDLRLSPTGTLKFSAMGQPLETQPCIFIDTSKTFQTLVGIGGALTDASAETFAKLPESEQKKLLEAYYDSEKGIGYTLARTHINSCDFSSHVYTYVADNDRELKTFSIQPDLEYRIPLIKKAMAAAGGKLTLYVAPWSPPAWMKTNNSMLHGGKLKPEFYQAWANYYVKFMKAYEAQGIPVWGLSVQNEPMATQTWESCIYTAENERDFVKNYLGPTLQKTGLGNKKLMVWDHNRDLIYQRVSTILSDKNAAKYIWGIAYHWYENWTGDNMFENVKRVKESFPNTNLMFTEGCLGPFNRDSLNTWSVGEWYGKNMMNDFNDGAVGWTDWNILLDEQGGPNHVGNYCFAPVHANVKDGSLHFMNSYYYIGHFSKFIKPGAKRIIASSSRAQLLTTAFKNKNGKIAVVVMNTSAQKIDFNLWMNGNAAATTALPHSIATYVIE